MTAPVAAAAGRAAAARAAAARQAAAKQAAAKQAGGAGKGARVGDAATGASLASMFDGGEIGKGAKAVSDTVAPPSQARKFLVAEFTLCLALLAFSPLTDKHKAERPGAFMKRASATMGVFFILGLVATGGRGASRAAAGFGGLVTLVLAISQRSILTVLTAKLNRGVGEDDPDDEGEYTLDPALDIPGPIGGVIGGVLGGDYDDDKVPDTGLPPTPLPQLFPVTGIR